MLSHFATRLLKRIVLYACGAEQLYTVQLHYIKTHGSESRGQGGSSKRHPDGLETHAHDYYTATSVVKIENTITKKP